jgi:hypothetical protein
MRYTIAIKFEGTWRRFGSRVYATRELAERAAARLSSRRPDDVFAVHGFIC